MSPYAQGAETVLGVMPDPDAIVKKVVEKLTGQKAR
jgi:hypothetical protein